MVTSIPPSMRRVAGARRLHVPTLRDQMPRDTALRESAGATSIAHAESYDPTVPVDEPPTTTPHRPEVSTAKVPVSLAIAAAWSWRLLAVGTLLYFLVGWLTDMFVLIIPLFLSIMFAALLQRPTVALRKRLPRSLAALIVLLGGLIVIGGVVYLVIWRTSSSSGQLTNQANQLFDSLRSKLARIPGVGLRTTDLVDQAKTYVTGHFPTILSGAFTVGSIALDLLTASVLTGFLTLFFLIDGDRMWAWFVRLMPRKAQQPANGAGQRAFHVLSGWISGTALIALIHGVVVGGTVALLGAPLALVLGILVFIGSFLPIIGAFLFGGFALLVVLVTKGVLATVILLGVLLLESLLEGHVYQPLIMGKTLGLHPVAILVVLAIGQLTGGIFGAIVAVPLTAAIHAGVKYVTGVEDIDGHSISGEDRNEPIPPLRSMPRTRAKTRAS